MIISFPTCEHESLKERLAKGQPIFTIRVSNERDRYELGKVYKTPWGDFVKVSEIKNLESIDEYPFINELTKRQIAAVRKYGLPQMLKLVIVQTQFPPLRQLQKKA